MDMEFWKLMRQAYPLPKILDFAIEGSLANI
jgi:hypothetical protein